MKYRVKPFGKGGLHIILRRADGFKEGDEVEVILASEKSAQERKEQTLRQFLEDYMEYLKFRNIYKKLRESETEYKS